MHFALMLFNFRDSFNQRLNFCILKDKHKICKEIYVADAMAMQNCFKANLERLKC